MRRSLFNLVGYITIIHLFLAPLSPVKAMLDDDKENQHITISLKEEDKEQNLTETTPLLSSDDTDTPLPSNMSTLELIDSLKKSNVELMTPENDNKLKAFFQSIVQGVKKKQQSGCKGLECRDIFIKSSKVTGFVLGGISTVAAYNLGMDFWDRFIENKNAAIAINLVGVVPLFALLTKLTGEKFEEAAYVITTPRKEREVKDPTCNKTVIYKVPLKFLGIIGAVVGSVGTTYLTKRYYEPLMGPYSLFLTIPTFIALVTTRYWALEHSAMDFSQFAQEKLAHCTKGGGTIKKKNELLKIFSQAQEIVKQLSNEKISELSSLLFGEEIEENLLSDQTNPSEVLYNFLRNNVELEPQKTQLTIKQKCKNVLGDIVGYVGWTIGTIGAWTVEPLTEQATTLFLNEFGVTNPSIVSKVSKAAGWTSWVVFSALTSFATKRIFSKYYQILTNASAKDIKQCSVKKGAEAALDFLLLGIAACSSTPRVDIGIQYVPDIKVVKPIILGACAIGRVALDFWALKENKESIKKFFTRNKEEVRKNHVVLFLEKIKKIIPEMNETQLDILHKKIFHNDIVIN